MEEETDGPWGSPGTGVLGGRPQQVFCTRELVSTGMARCLGLRSQETLREDGEPPSSYKFIPGPQYEQQGAHVLERGAGTGARVGRALAPSRVVRIATEAPQPEPMIGQIEQLSSTGCMAADLLGRPEKGSQQP